MVTSVKCRPVRTFVLLVLGHVLAVSAVLLAAALVVTRLIRAVFDVVAVSRTLALLCGSLSTIHFALLVLMFFLFLALSRIFVLFNNTFLFPNLETKLITGDRRLTF
jgi:hypothetical protein